MLTDLRAPLARPPRGNPAHYRGGLTARKKCGCGRARRAGYGGYGGYVVSAARRRGRRDAARRGLRAVGSASRIDVTMRRVCGHARRPALPPRSGGCAALGLPAHGHTHTAYLLSCWVPWLRGLRWERAAARNDERAAHAALQLVPINRRTS